MLLGEIRTTLLQNSRRVSADTAARLLDIDPASQVYTATRPFPHVLSPDQRTGVHCPLATGSGTSADGVGTVLARASVTGGVILQASARACLVRASAGRRLPWSHYLSNPGVIEVIGRPDSADLAAGFLREPGRGPAADPVRASLDLGSIADRLLNRVQRMPYIDRTTMLRARRTKLRFAATWSSTEPAAPSEPGEQPTADIEFVIHDEALRTVHLRLPSQFRDLAAVTAVCEDLALHDWLLSTVGALVENSLIGVDPAAVVVDRLRPVIDHLLHLWMPGAKAAETLAGVWAALERRPGFTRQWVSLRGQIQNQLLLAILEKPAGGALTSGAVIEGFSPGS